MGVVYRALHLPLDREVALKLIIPELSADTDFRERFKRESRVAASLDHPHAIPIYHASESEGLLYITMRYVEGTDLREQILQRGALPPEEVCEIATQIAGALHAAHQLGIVHRDVKPANILIGGSTGRPHAYLTDFGLTKMADSEEVLTRSGMIMGSFDYIAPEQLEGRPGRRAHRRLRDGLRDLRGAHRRRALPARHRPREAVRAHRHPAALGPGGAARPARRRSTSWSRPRWPRSRTTATRAPPRWPRRCRPRSAAAHPQTARRPRPRCPSRCRRSSSRRPARSRSWAAPRPSRS